MTRILAFVGPIALWVVVYAIVMGFRDEEQVIADENAGRVFNARVVRGNVVDAIDEMLATRRPRVVVIGPSYANTNVRPVQLAEHLGLEAADIALISIPNSVGAHWYAVLKYRLLEAGHRPDLVLFVSGLQSMLLTTPLSESSFVNLQVHLPDGGDPRIDAKVRGSADLWWATVREQRGKVRGAFFEAVRDASVFWLEPDPTRRSLARVFDDAKVDMSLYGHAMPVIESTRRTDRGFTPDLLPSPEASFLGDITELASASALKAVWVRPPMSPHIPPELDDVVPTGFQSRAIAVVEAAGGAYVDLRHLRMSTRMYRNEDHMNAEGSQRFSKALARIVEERGWLGTTEVPPWPLEISRPGSSDVLAPGETLTVVAPEPWPEESGAFAVWLSAESRGERETAPFELAFDGQPVTMMRGRAVPHDGDVYQQWRVGARFPAPAASSTVTLTASSRGPGVVVQALAFGQEAPRTYAVGDEAALRGVRVELLGQREGALLADGVTLQTPRPAAPVPHARREIGRQPGGVAAFETSRIGFLSDEVLQGTVSWSEPCSPLRVAEDDVLLPLPNAPCPEVRSQGGGRSCHTRDALFFSASDGTDPLRNGRTYELRLADVRACGGEVFVYPNDLLRFTLDPQHAARFRRGARFVTLRGRYLQRRRTQLLVRLRVGEERVLERRFDGRRFELGPVSLRLEAAAAFPNDEPWVLEIENLDRTFYLIRGVSLSERSLVQ